MKRGIKVTKELLVEIVNRNLLLEITLIIMAYSAVNFVNFKLGFQILGIKTGIRKILPGVIILVLYNFYGRQVLPDLVYGLVLVIIYAVLLKVIGKVSLLKTFWTAFLVVLITGIGVLVIQNPLCSLNKGIASFLLETHFGIAVGSLIELTFPVIALFILSTFQISLTPPFKKRITLLDFLGVFLFGDILFLFYSALTRILFGLQDSSKHAINMNITFEWAAAVAGGVTFYIIHVLTHKERDYEQRLFEEEKTELLNKIRELINANNNLIVNDLIYKLQDVNSSTNHTKAGVDPDNTNPLRIVLTPRERIVTELIVQGKTNKEIGAEIYLSEGGVKNIITKLLDRLNLEDRTQLAVFAVKNKLIN